ncbi:hypothetical protein J2128_001764 [Methanomicrobium sp. W14]|uniref:hypothetical protein n=1 Tax=Methanomicrobium sp. W14 TaxID=2817839 RepID=UPI001AE534CA|nr:hypothetical protein [Methanomicrobium sp. W14]MBP2133810.1 hypothetical protein [Methanomicrobium sp. W14]
MTENDIQCKKSPSSSGEYKISVIGYDETARSHLFNLRDSGLDVIVGVRPGKSWERASKDGFEVYPMVDAARASDIVATALPAEIVPGIYSRYLKKYMAAGDKSLILADAASPALDILDISHAHKPAVFTLFTQYGGKRLREEYLAGRKFRAYYGIGNGFSGDFPDEKYKNLISVYAKGIGSSDENLFCLNAKDISCAWTFLEMSLSEYLKNFAESAGRILDGKVQCQEFACDMIDQGLLSALKIDETCISRLHKSFPFAARKKEDYLNSTGDEIKKMISKAWSGELLREKMLSGKTK